MESLGKFPDPFLAEIAGQPDALRRAAEQVAAAESMPALESAAADLRGPVVFTGMGSSYDACYPAVAELARAGTLALQLDAAELLHFRMEGLRTGTTLVAVSQSGESAEVVRVVGSLRDRTDRPQVLAVTNAFGSTLAGLADHVLITAAGEESGPSTMTFAAALVVVGAVARALAGMSIATVVRRTRDEAELASAALERLHADSELEDRLEAWLGERDLVLLGRGPARAAAEMGALTIKEAAGIPVESLQTAQFRHGPLELAGSNLAAMILATEPETAAVDVALAEELSALGAASLVVSRDAGPAPGEHSLRLAIGPLDRTVAPAVSILPAQLLAHRLAVRRGREPGAYVHAAKVTTRE